MNNLNCWGSIAVTILFGIWIIKMGQNIIILFVISIIKMDYHIIIIVLNCYCFIPILKSVVSVVLLLMIVYIDFTSNCHY